MKQKNTMTQENEDPDDKDGTEADAKSVATVLSATEGSARAGTWKRLETSKCFSSSMCLCLRRALSAGMRCYECAPKRRCLHARAVAGARRAQLLVPGFPTTARGRSQRLPSAHLVQGSPRSDSRGPSLRDDGTGTRSANAGGPFGGCCPDSLRDP